MQNETEVVITINGERDKIAGIEESEESIDVIYERSGQTRIISVSQKMVIWMYNAINEYPVGEPIKSTALFNKYIREHKIKSDIVESRLKIIKDILNQNNINSLKIDNIIFALENIDSFILMTFKELIGSRDTENSLYFKLYSTLKYWQQKGEIEYNSKGYVYRLN